MSSLPRKEANKFWIVKPAEINSVGGAISSAEKKIYRKEKNTTTFASLIMKAIKGALSVKA